MKHLTDIDLYGQNTMRLHCVASNVYEPENIADLQQVLFQLNRSRTSYHILGGGSNVLMPEIIENVVSMHAMKAEVSVDGRLVKADASVSIQKLIRICQKYNLGGIEFLFTLPCQLGGAIYMNAGRGGEKSISISDFVKSVTYIDSYTGVIRTLTKEQCQFSHRDSVFQHNNWVIVCAELELEKKNEELVQRDIEVRLERSHKYLDAGKPSCGSVFCQYNSHIMSLLKGFKIGGAGYSAKTINWISNLGKGSYRDILRLIRVAVFLHIITFQKYKVEIKIW